MQPGNAQSMCRSLRSRVTPRCVRLLLAMLLLWTPVAPAQTKLGEVLDAGGTLLSIEDFKQELMQRVLIGPTPAGGSLEIMYAANGAIQGSGTPPQDRVTVRHSPYEGEWTVGENGAVCATIRIKPPGGGGTAFVLPRRCQFWFKLGERYYLSDSDSDRQAKVLVRTIKP